MKVNNEEFYHIDYNNKLLVGNTYSTKENGLYDEVYNNEYFIDGRDAIELLNEKRKNKDSKFSIEELNLITDTLSNQAFVSREIVFEDVRRDKFNDLPSRLNCLYVCKDLDEIRSWINVLKRNKKEKYKVYKLRLKGNIFCGNASFVLRQCVSINKKIEQANKYWSGDETNLIPEYLFEGDFEVIERIDDIC